QLVEPRWYDDPAVALERLDRAATLLVAARARHPVPDLGPRAPPPPPPPPPPAPRRPAPGRGRGRGGADRRVRPGRRLPGKDPGPGDANSRRELDFAPEAPTAGGSSHGRPRARVRDHRRRGRRR